MATKTIQTRIKNRFDTLENWSKAGVTLLPGEIALVSVTTKQIDTTTGNVVNVPAVLMKVGESDGNGGSKAFSALPWLSAKASDVYDWAKNEHAKDIPVVVTVGDQATSKTLGAWLKQINDSSNTNAGEIARVDAKVDVTKVSTAIATAISNLKFETGTTGEYVKALTLADGKVTVTKGNLPEATKGSTTKGIVALGVSGGAADHDAVFGTNGLSFKVNKNASDIEGLKTSVAGGVHFRGTTTTALTDGATTNTIKINGNNYPTSGTLGTTHAGDVVLYGEKEFIWTGSAWEELGDLGRVGTLESWRQGLNVTTVADGAATNSKFITAVTQADGKIAVTSIQPTVSDIKYDASNTLASYLESHVGKLEDKVNLADGDTVTGKIDGAINALKATSPSTSGNTTDYQFIDTVSQTNGKISATKKTIPDATTSVKGVTKLSSATDSSSEALAATPKAVKAAYDKGADAQARVEHVEGNYVRFNTTDSKLYVGKSGVDVIIFDCGGAADL